MKRLIITTALLVSAALVFAQEVPFNGQVVDAKGSGIKKVNVTLLSSGRTIQTDKKGMFGFFDVEPTDSLKIEGSNFSCTIAVNGRKSIKIKAVSEGDFSLAEDQQLEDMGFKVIKESYRLEPGEAISGERLRNLGYDDIFTALSDLVAGVNLVFDKDGNASISIRNNGTPLYVVDDIVVNDLTGYTIYSVKTVEILKDGAQYGSRGGNGVVRITTH